MLDMHRYFDGNHVNRETIAVDIREQRLSHEELMSIIADRGFLSGQSFKEPVGQKLFGKVILFSDKRGL